MVDSFIRQIKEEHSTLGSFKVIATGGISTLLEKSLKEVEYIDKSLTIDGLFLICQQHCER
jgi:pantothenate kinase type III